MKKYLKILIIPLSLLVFVLLLDLVWKKLNLPPEEELIPIIKTYFDAYGIWLVFAASVIESAFVLGVYAPGGLVIFLGVIFSIGSPMHAVAVVFSVILGFMIGFSFDYMLGKYGWYRFFLHFGLREALERTKVRVEKYGMSTAWLGYHHPDFGSFIATTYGILGYSYRKFFALSFPPVAAWCAFWGVLTYVLGDAALKLMSYKMLLVILGVWIIARIIEVRIAERKAARALSSSL
jgi:membrane protein DedA with SNARE-associated domain